MIDGLFRVVHPKQAQHYKSFFSSELGGIVVDPALMVVHIDDHFVHRGHGVFDTAILIDGYLYQLDQHMDRFLNSAKLANIELPFSREQMRRTILETAAASRATNGMHRLFLGRVLPYICLCLIRQCLTTSGMRTMLGLSCLHLSCVAGRPAVMLHREQAFLIASSLLTMGSTSSWWTIICGPKPLNSFVPRLLCSKSFQALLTGDIWSKLAVGV